MSSGDYAESLGSEPEATLRIAGAIRAHLVDTYPADTADLELDSDLISRPLNDSLAIVTTVAFLEEEFAIRVKRAHINRANFGSIAALSEYVSSQLKQSGG